jgi:hypothetical protein
MKLEHEIEPQDDRFHQVELLVLFLLNSCYLLNHPNVKRLSHHSHVGLDTNDQFY